MRLSNVVASELMDLKLRYLLIFSGGYEHRKNNKYRIFYFARATFKTRRTNGDNVHCGKVWNGSLGMSITAEIYGRANIEICCTASISYGVQEKLFKDYEVLVRI